MIWLLLACAQPSTATAVAPTWDGWAHGFFVGYCASCHAATTPDRHGAPASVTFDTEAEVDGQLDAIRRTVLEDGTMPVAGGVFPDDLDRLRAYLDAR